MKQCFTRTIRPGAVLLLLGGLMPCSGSPPVGQSSSTASTPQKSPGSFKHYAVAQQLFAEHCARCHTIDGVNNMPGPDLSDYGTFGWSRARVAAFIADPQLYLPGTRMPEFHSQLTPRQIGLLADYCNSLRSTELYRMQNHPLDIDGSGATDATTDALALDTTPGTAVETSATGVLEHDSNAENERPAPTEATVPIVTSGTLPRDGSPAARHNFGMLSSGRSPQP